ncbi:MAG: AAA family ATPase [Candidatus Nanopelagicales bacterium]
MDDPIIASLLAAVEASPGDAVLRLHLARMLLDAGRVQEAVAQTAQVLGGDPGNAAAQAVMAEALGSGRGPSRPDPVAADASGRDFDWDAADAEMADVVEPMFVEPLPDAAYPTEVVRPSLRLSDVGGMKDVKERIEISFLMPMRNPELRSAYGKSLRGGLLLYGPPGCGKTYLARAVAGELDAAFITVALSDVLDMWVGSSERNIHDVFQAARAKAPCVLFLDEVDAIGQKRSQNRNSGARNSVNQLLHELDGVEENNEGVFVLAATNHPWDVDEALRRPGRLDRMLAVLPPDLEAREAIFRHHLEKRPVVGIDLAALARASDGLTGADIALVCESAAERAMVDSVRSGTVRLIGMGDLEAARADVRPSALPWLETAKTVVEFANASGQYDDLKAYLKKRRLL